MKKKKDYIKYTKDRVLLSDILPFELPLIFSNRHLYNYLLSQKLEIRKGKVYSSSKDFINKTIIKLLLGVSVDEKFNKNGILDFKNKSSIPFVYRICHKENDYRELCVIHPKNQIQVIDFYREYKDLILYYCSISPFSIRKPYRVAKYTFFDDNLHVDKLVEENDETVEEHKKEYENLKTFFAYKDHSNIYKFYESTEYHRCEKKYDKLLKTDITKCFDSLYTHSVAWALLDKSVVKKFLNEKGGTFGDKFDGLMQKLNYSETNGIVIGPEFSRVFAEIILQRIDLNIKNDLTKDGVFFKKDYEIFRYVDDYFVYYNEERVKDKILAVIKIRLKEFKLSLNNSKTQISINPIVTPITIAKERIADLISEALSYSIKDVEYQETLESEIIIKKEGSIFVNSKKIITRFKTIIYELDIDYKDILNYTFPIIERKLISCIKDYFKIEHKKNTQKQFVKSLVDILDFVFYIYSASPRVNTTIKLCRILRRVIETLNIEDEFNYDLKHLVFKNIYDNIFFVLRKNKTIENTQVETLYLLIALGELGKNYWLSEEVLAEYLRVDYENKVVSGLNYFSLTVSLFYMKNKKRYKDLRDCIVTEIVEQFKAVDIEARRERTELIFLLFDSLTCPYITSDVKKELLSLYSIKDSSQQAKIIKERANWFINWSNFDFGKELDAKKSQEVY